MNRQIEERDGISTSNKVLTVTWNMEDPYTEQDFKRTLKATDLCSAIFDFKGFLRRCEDTPAMDENTVEQIRLQFYSILEEHDINIDDIYS